MAHQIVHGKTPPVVAIAVGDEQYRNTTSNYLSNRGFDSITIEPAVVLGQEADLPGADICLLDLNLGGNPGASLRTVERLVQDPAAPKVLGLAPLDDESTRIAALTAGADRCLIMPVGLLELEANIHACLNGQPRIHRGGAAGGDVWQLRTDAWELITPDGGTMPLSAAEFVFLKGLFEAGDQPLARHQLYRLMGVQANEPGLDARIDVMVARLRRKAQRHLGSRIPVKTVSGVGHLFAAPCGFAG